MISTQALLRGCVGLSMLTLLGGCESVFVHVPASGPHTLAIESHIGAGLPTAQPYAVVDLRPEVPEILSQFEPAVLAGAFTDRRPPTAITFGIGDAVTVTIFEAAAGGLFIPIEAGVRPGNFVTLPDQSVDNDGNISVPYAGTIKAAGRTNVQIQNDIVERIRNRAIEPQVVVALSRQNSNFITVFGAVNSSQRFPVPGIGAKDRITDVIARSGGPSGPGWEIWVTLERSGKRATVPFANLIYQPANDVYVQPGDRIYLYREPQRFIAFGATGTQGQIPFNTWQINMTEAVALAGGLFDLQADPAAVYLYRQEPKEVAKKLGIEVDRFKGDLVPIIFRASFRDPSGYFTSTKFQMRHGDVIFAANSSSVEATKFMAYINTMIGTAQSGIGLRNTIKNGL